MIPLPALLCLARDPRLIVNLESQAFQVLQTVSDLEAVNHYQRNQPEVEGVIVDHTIPELSGVIVLKTLRYLGYQGAIWILVDQISLQDFQNYQAAGVTCFWQKPVSYPFLATLLWHSVSLRQHPCCARAGLVKIESSDIRRTDPSY